MHKIFYASGFLYHPPTEQILLQQSEEDGATLSTFSGKSSSKETVEDVFRRIISTRLGIVIPKKNINRVYDYFHEALGEHYYLLYAEIRKPTLNFKLKGISTVGWFPLKQIPKLKLTEQIRQDITVGQRVINLIERQKQEGVLQKEA